MDTNTKRSDDKRYAVVTDIPKSIPKRPANNRTASQKGTNLKAEQMAFLSVTESVLLPRASKIEPGTVVEIPEHITPAGQLLETSEFVVRREFQPLGMFVRHAHQEVPGMPGMVVELNLDIEKLSDEDKALIKALGGLIFEGVVITGLSSTVFLKQGTDLYVLPHHYRFENAEQEREWIIRAVLEGRSPRTYNGRPVRLSSNVIKDAAERIRTHLSETIGPVLDDERGELGQIQKEKDDLEQEKAEAIKIRDRANEEASMFAKGLEAKRKEGEKLDKSLSEKKRDRDSLDLTIESTRKRLEQLKGQVQGYEKRLEEWRTHQTDEDSKIKAHTEKLRDCQIVEDEREAVRHLADELEHRTSRADIIALHVSLKLFPFLVLTGPSGTGKSSLLQLYAQAMGMYCTLIPVQPNWTSVADLHGYVTYIGKQRFVQTPFSRALGRQCARQDFVDLVILDEINLSQVEYFMADYLSAFETGERRVHLANADELEELEEGRIPGWLKASRGEVYVSPTLLIAGTANEDHTTRPFSEKFRDRAAIMQIEGFQTNATISLVDRERTSESIKPIRIAPEIFRQWQNNPLGQPSTPPP